MPNTRRSTARSPDKKQQQLEQVAKTEQQQQPRKRKAPAKKQQQQQQPARDDSPEVVETPAAAESSRPRRNVRKSALFTSGEYEVSLPGNVKEEDEEEEGAEYGVDPNGPGPVPMFEEAPTSSSRPRRQQIVSVQQRQEEVQEQEEVEEHYVQPPPPKRGRGRQPRPITPPVMMVQEEVEVQPEEEHVIEMEEDMVGMEEAGLEEEEEENSREMGLIDIDHLGQEVDVETMSNLEVGDVDHEEYIKGFDYEEDDDDEHMPHDDIPPMLERASDGKRKRGRPRKYPQGQTPFRRTNNGLRRSSTVRDPTAPSPRNKYTYDKPLTKIEAEKINSFNVKLFDDNIGVTEHGDVYATVIQGCLSYLLRKERIIELLTNRNEVNAIRDAGWMQPKPPRLPPLSPQKVCYAFYIDGSTITSIRDLSTDDLKPWTTSSNDPSLNEPVVKPNVRKHPVIRQGGKLVPTKGDPRGTEIHLTEYSAWLPRCLRLRKKIFYLARAGHIIGNVLILYDFTTTGDIPVLVNVIHGNEAFRGNHTDLEFERGHLLFVGDTENPFEEGMVEGPRGERFFSVRPDRYGWTNNKKLLLRWLINEPQLLETSGCLNRCIPYLPPMTTDRGVYVYFAPASCIQDQLHFTGDGLSPWTYQGAAVNHRVRTVKKALVQDSMGNFQTSKEEWQSTGLALVETITILCRQPRLRKRIIYVQRSNSVILGNVCYIYEYMQPGPLPEIVKVNNRASSASVLGAQQDMVMRSGHHHLHEKPASGLMADEDNVDVEELIEETVSDDLHLHQTIPPVNVSAFSTEPLEFEELPEDSLNGGWDTDFEEDVLVSQESAAPFFEGVRSLEDGHNYLTVRHKRTLCNNDTILEFIINSDFVEEKNLVNTSKPSHPPLVRNARAYVFFVNGQVVFPHDINRDDFSPWSANATAERPTCYRSKVRKYGVMRDPKTMRYVMQEGDYKLFPYHLVSLYSIHPKEDRLRKRINYLMETASKVIISHVMIMYDYNQEGAIPRLNGPYGKRMIRRRPLRRLTGEMSEVLEDVSDESESEKPSPFATTVQTMDNGEMYLLLTDDDFMQDRNRQLNYLYNKTYLLEQLGCVNVRVPQYPPLIPGVGAFIFFIDGQIDNRMLTCDGLGPWSENVTLSSGEVVCRRPKTHRLPCGANRENQLRLIRGNKKFPQCEPDYQMHIYAATLPRCPRLKKRVIYITRDSVQIGMSMIAYWYSEEGEIPQPVVHGNAIHTDTYYNRLPAPVKEEARQMLMNSMLVPDIVKELTAKHVMPIHPRSILNVRRELRQAGLLPPDDPTLAKDLKMDGTAGFDHDSMMDMEPPEGWVSDDREEGEAGGAGAGTGGAPDVTTTVRGRRLQTGARGVQLDYNQLVRYVRSSMGIRSEEQAFDAIWKSLVVRDEQRILRNIKADFGVEIVADQHNQIVDESTILHGGIIEGEIVEEEILDEGQILEGDVVMDHYMGAEREDSLANFQEPEAEHPMEAAVPKPAEEEAV